VFSPSRRGGTESLAKAWLARSSESLSDATIGSGPALAVAGSCLRPP
jgi:hypothetical protein